MGSVKDLVILQAPTEKECGKAHFIFSDRYSVFDWGEMPDHIKEKGTAICLATAYFFEKIEAEGIPTHYLGIVEDGKLKNLKDLKTPQNTLALRLLRVIRPKVVGNTYDYSIYNKERSNLLIPLEFVYRNSLPQGSSVFRRLKEGSLKLEDISLKEMPTPGQILEKPIVDISTKLEATDRYITFEEAKHIAGLNGDEINEIKRIILFVNELITQSVKKIGLFNEDGKCEFGFNGNRNLILVDALGTLDECRFSIEGLPVSKEIVRIYYRKSNWYNEVEKAKNKDKINWKNYVKSSPEPLPKRLTELISMMYKAYTNEITQRTWFNNVKGLKEIIDEIKEFI